MPFHIERKRKCIRSGPKSQCQLPLKAALACLRHCQEEEKQSIGHTHGKSLEWNNKNQGYSVWHHFLFKLMTIYNYYARLKTMIRFRKPLYGHYLSSGIACARACPWKLFNINLYNACINLCYTLIFCYVTCIHVSWWMFYRTPLFSQQTSDATTAY